MILLNALSRAFLASILVITATCRADLINQSSDQLEALISTTFGKGQIVDLDESIDSFDQASSSSSDDMFFEDYEDKKFLDFSSEHKESGLETIVRQKLDEKVKTQDDGLNFDQLFEKEDGSSFDEKLPVESTEDPLDSFNIDIDEVNPLDAPPSDKSWEDELFSNQEIKDNSLNIFNEVLPDKEDQNFEEVIPAGFNAADPLLKASEDSLEGLNIFNDAASLSSPVEEQTSSSAIEIIEAVEPVNESLGDVYNIPIESEEKVNDFVLDSIDDVNVFDEPTENIEFSVKESANESVDDLFHTSSDPLDMDTDFAQEELEELNVYDSSTERIDPESIIEKVDLLEVEMVNSGEAKEESLDEMFDMSMEEQKIDFSSDKDVYDEYDYDAYDHLDDPWDSDQDLIFDNERPQVNEDQNKPQDSNDIIPYDQTLVDDVTQEEPQTTFHEELEKDLDSKESLDHYSYKLDEDRDIDDISSKTMTDLSESMEEIDDLPGDADQEDIFRDPALESDVIQEEPQSMSLEKSEKVIDSIEPVGPYSYELDEDLDIDDIGLRTVIDLSESMEELEDLAKEADQEDMFRDPVDTVEEMKELYGKWANVFADDEYESTHNGAEPVWLKNGRYRLKIGDRLLISIYGAGGTTQEVVIDFTGCFSYLLIGEVFALGKTVDEIRDELNVKVSDIFRFAFISVTPISFEGHYFTILGEVNAPGKKTLRARTTLLGAICQAGGFKSGSYRTQTIDIANLKHAFLARNGEYIPVDFEALVIEGDVSEDVVLQSQDYIYIPSSLHREISILGEVSFPTTIGFLNEVTLAEAISQARGVTPDASSRVVVIRGALSNPETYLIDFNRIVKGYEKDFRLAPGDIVYVPSFKLKNFRDIIRLGIRSFISSFSGAGGADLFEAMVPDSSSRRPDLGGF